MRIKNFCRLFHGSALSPYVSRETWGWGLGGGFFLRLRKLVGGTRHSEREPALGIVDRNAPVIVIGLRPLVEFEPSELTNQRLLATRIPALFGREGGCGVCRDAGSESPSGCW